MLNIMSLDAKETDEEKERNKKTIPKYFADDHMLLTDWLGLD